VIWPNWQVMIRTGAPKFARLITLNFTRRKVI
jgi:hypothetical protein